MDFLEFFWVFFVCFFVSFKVTKVTTKCYHGYYWKPKIAKNGPKQQFFFCQRAKKASAEGRSPPQELEVGPRSGPYLLFLFNNFVKTHSLSSIGVNLVIMSNDDQ